MGIQRKWDSKWKLRLTENGQGGSRSAPGDVNNHTHLLLLWPPKWACFFSAYQYTHSISCYALRASTPKDNWQNEFSKHQAVVVCAFNTSTWEADRWVWVWGQCCLQSKFQFSQEYTEKPFSGKKGGGHSKEVKWASCKEEALEILVTVLEIPYSFKGFSVHTCYLESSVLSSSLLRLCNS